MLALLLPMQCFYHPDTRNHYLRLDCVQKGFCGSPQQLMSSLWETNSGLVIYVANFPPDCLYYCKLSVFCLMPFSLTMLQQSPVSFYALLSIRACVAAVLVGPCCISIFQTYTYQHFFLPFVRLRCLCLASHVFLLQLLIFLSCCSSAPSPLPVPLTYSVSSLGF